MKIWPSRKAEAAPEAPKYPGVVEAMDGSAAKLRAWKGMPMAWQEQYGLPLTLGVNLSPLQLRQPDLVQIISDCLETTGMNPSHLDLEITESLSIKSIPGLRETLGRIRDLGCRISIDDFGTGP